MKPKIYVDKERFTELINQGLRLKDIASVLNISTAVVRKRMIEWNLSSCFVLKMNAEQKKKISEAKKKWNAENPEKLRLLMIERAKRKNCSPPCERLKEILRLKNIVFEEEYPPLLHKNRYFSIDIAFPDKKIGIEVNGNQHYNPDGSLKPRYQERHNLIKQEGWKLYEVYFKICYKDEEINKILDEILNSPVTEKFQYGVYQPIVKKQKRKYPKGDNSWRKLPRFKARKCQRPDKETLNKLVWEKPMLEISKIYNVSDTSIKEWCQEYELTCPPQGYWTRRKCGYNHEESLNSREKTSLKRRIISEEILTEAQKLIESGMSFREVAKQIGFSRECLKYTLNKKGIFLISKAKKGRHKKTESA